MDQSPDDQLADAMRDVGITPPASFEFDGKIHRFSSNGRKASKAGWYIIFDNQGLAAGSFGCWQQGFEQTWHAKGWSMLNAKDRSLLDDLNEAKRSAFDNHREMIRSAAIQGANDGWETYQDAVDHPYLTRKMVGAHGCKVAKDGRLAIPLYNDNWDLVSIQYINDVGEKRYHYQTSQSDAFFVIGDVKGGQPLYLAEGFATAATIHEATGYPCGVSFTAHNMVSVAKTMRRLLGTEQQIIIVADNDVSGTGQRSAHEAALCSDAQLIVPPEPGDINDLGLAGYDIQSMLMPREPGAYERLQVVSGADLPVDFIAPDEIIEGLITSSTLNIIYGGSNAGKTFFMLSLATSVAESISIFPGRVDGGAVLYLATESPGSVTSRLQAIKQYWGVSLAQLYMVPVPLNFHESASDTREVMRLCEEIYERDNTLVKLIIGDTFARLSAGANENSGVEMGPVLARFEALARHTEAAVILIHHPGKDAEKGGRGWSGIRAFIDTEIEVTEQDDIRCATIVKQRELSSKGQKIYFDLKSIDMGLTKFGAVATTCVAVPASPPEPGEIKPLMQDAINRMIYDLRRAWERGNGEILDNAPYIASATLYAYLIEDKAMTERKAQEAMAPEADGHMICELTRSEIISRHLHGWIVCSEIISDAMLLQ